MKGLERIKPDASSEKCKKAWNHKLTEGRHSSSGRCKIALTKVLEPADVSADVVLALTSSLVSVVVMPAIASSPSLPSLVADFLSLGCRSWVVSGPLRASKL